MAPRGRTRKIGNTRMAVAVDAMSEFGFSPETVRRSVKHLLKVYGGDDCWLFIERDSYKVLIEFILDTDNHQDSDNEIEQEMAPTNVEASTSGPSVGPMPESTLDSLSLENDALELGTADNEPGSEDDNNVETVLANGEQGGGGVKKSQTCEVAKNNESEPTRKRQRAFRGWLADEDEEELVHLTPEALPEAVEKCLKEERESRVRVRRWDVAAGPNGLL